MVKNKIGRKIDGDKGSSGVRVNVQVIDGEARGQYLSFCNHKFYTVILQTHYHTFRVWVLLFTLPILKLELKKKKR